MTPLNEQPLWVNPVYVIGPLSLTKNQIDAHTLKGIVNTAISM